MYLLVIASRKFHCTFSKYHRAVTAKQRKLQSHGQLRHCRLHLHQPLKKIFFCPQLFGHQWKVCHNYYFNP